ncbi:MAG TPA: hypothetical protein VLA76_05795 [Candidatus Angelobacter sp.]|nr:hypothetical protein [Candidatus Angelobacter sp.]
MNDEYVTASAAWFTLSLVNAGLAQGKGRSGLNWWLLSLFLGPVATFLVVTFPRGGAGTAGTGPAGTGPAGTGPAGRMSQQQALIIGGAVILALLLVLGAFRFLAG